jgi:uncharacterized membrane protein (DUF373 family)
MQGKEPVVTELREKLRNGAERYLQSVEVLFYVVLGALLVLTAATTVGEAAYRLWSQASQGALAKGVLEVLDQLLLALMLVEILHTVRISIRSQVLETEPFLIVALIASIRRLLVITMEAANFNSQVMTAAEHQRIFRESMLELAVLGPLILILVFAIWLLRGRAQSSEQKIAGAH